MKTLTITIIAIFAIALAACNVPTQVPPADDSQATADAVNETVQANNQFALEIYSKLAEDGKNTFLSPWSISTAFAVAYEGARGKTAEEMASVLHLQKDDTTRRSSFAALYNMINLRDKEYTLSTANALWAEQDYKFLDSYMGTAEQYYRAGATNMDFKNNAEGSRQEINTWVEKQTNNRIKDLIGPGQINPMTLLVMTNAVYFKGDWAEKFKKSNTKTADFKLSNGQTANVDMMHQSEDFGYAQVPQGIYRQTADGEERVVPDLQLLEMPYKGEQLSMLVLLPAEGKMAWLEDNLNAGNLSLWKSMMLERELQVSFPKFKFDTKYPLVETLSSMGMPTAFSENADLSGMDGTNTLYIATAVHQAFVNVDEEGTEAAAATAWGAFAKSAMPLYFNADHPFLFIIQERSTGGILFIGKMENPAD